MEIGAPTVISRRFPLLPGAHDKGSTSQSAGRDYLGCFKDTPDRDITGSHSESPTMSVEICLATCREGGYSVAGLQFASHCFCGNAHGRFGPAQNCDMACSGDGSEICGGEWANAVYAVR